MKLNLSLRLKNKATLISLVTCVCTFIYQVMGIVQITPSISEDTATQFGMLVVTMLFGLGIIVDPTTKGIGDSGQALKYKEPR